MKFNSEYSPVTAENLINFLKQHKLKKIPTDYANFLRKYNGGSPDHDLFKVYDCKVMETSILSFFYSIDSENFNSMEFNTISYALKRFQNSIPKKTLPIATDDFGNIICLVLAGKNKNKVFIWIHDYPAKERSWENMFFISNDFLSFIGSLEKSGICEIEFDEEKDVCRKGDLDSLRKILEKKPGNKRVIELAESCAAFGHIELLEFISEEGYPINDPVILWQAFAGRQAETVLYLLDKYGNIYYKLSDGSSWLHLAAEYNLLKVAEYLIDKGVDISHRNDDGFSAYNEAGFSKSNEVEELLKKHMKK